MRLAELITESLHDVLLQFKQDAQLLADGLALDIGVVELAPDWEDELPRLIHRFTPKASTMNEQLKATHDFLLQHKLATRVK